MKIGDGPMQVGGVNGGLVALAMYQLQQSFTSQQSLTASHPKREGEFSAIVNGRTGADGSARSGSGPGKGSLIDILA
jgi:hypothetical protein